MRIFFLVLFFLTLALFVPAQQKTVSPPDQRPDRRMDLSLDKLLRPDKSDRDEAKRLGVEVFRILPRETYDGKIAMRGGGAYYSFVTKYGSAAYNPSSYVVVQSGVGNAYQVEERNEATLSSLRILPRHQYGSGSDLELQRGKFSVGFAGANYGFLYDLGEQPLKGISLKTPPAVFLGSYEPPAKMTEVRAEQSKIFHNPAYEANGFGYKRSVPAVVGHTYILRSINFRSSDVMVALKVHRQDTDGSLIVFWKKLKTFPTPEIDKSK